MEALTIKDLYKYYGGICALRNLSLCVKEGERLAIIGPNGAGKTTLFNIVDGGSKADKGEFFFFGKAISHLSTYNRTRIGIVRSFQLTSLFSNLSVLNNILLALHGILPSRFSIFHSINSYKSLNDRGREILERMDLWNKRNAMVEQISYGEQRKLEIALCIAAKPKLLLLDEPSCGLTITESRDIGSLINKFGRQVTVLLIAHDIDLVYDVAERIVVLHHGTIVAEGTPENIACNTLVRDIYMGK